MKSEPSEHPKHEVTIYSNTYRTHHCNALRIEHVGDEVSLCGWVHSIRDHGGVLFIMLRDQYGLTQCVSSDKAPEEIFKKSETLRLETMIKITGIVTKRSSDAINEKLPTGAIEIPLKTLEILNKSDPIPFEINQSTPTNKDESIKYRYLYLRRPDVREIFLKRSALTTLIRTFLTKRGFLEIETPLLTKTTPEGARDFLVPSRVYPGEFYALPQSPQQYKQLLMVAGFDKYFQLARALRDEDSRADRQAEHTQLDLEMAFIERDNIIALLEELVIFIKENLFPSVTIPSKPFPRLSYRTCIEEYGSDKPDLRFGLKIHNVTAAFKDTEFNIFKKILAHHGRICALTIEKKRDETRKNLDELIELAVTVGLKGLIWATAPQKSTSSADSSANSSSDVANSSKSGDKLWRASSGKVIADREFEAVRTAIEAHSDDLILIAGDSDTSVLLENLGRLRVKVAERYHLIPPNEVAFAFVTEFPLFHWNSNEKRLDPLHHMFVLPNPDGREQLEQLEQSSTTHKDITEQQQILQEKFRENPDYIRSTQFDLVANGYELCSGSERIYTSALQKQIMRLIGLSDEEISSKFTHLLSAFDYGAPPHGGAAPGIDRLLMAFCHITNIRDVIAFPKTQRGQDLMMGSPSPASASQLKDLALKIDYANMKEERVDYLKNIKTFKEKLF